MKNKTTLLVLGGIIVIAVILSTDHTFEKTLRGLGLTAGSGDASPVPYVPIKPTVVNFLEITQQTVKDNKKNIKADTHPPMIVSVFPTPNDTLSGITALKVQANDNVGVASVEYFVDGKSVGKSTTPPFIYMWDTTKVTTGSYTLVAKALDLNGNTTTSRGISFAVDNSDPFNKQKNKKKGGYPQFTSSDFAGQEGTSVCDCNIAVGPKDIVAVNNYSISTYDKNGVPTTSSISLEKFFDPTNTYIPGALFQMGSARAYFDDKSQKFFVTSISTSRTRADYTFLAVSQTSDPTGNWWVYPFSHPWDTGNNGFYKVSYPQLGVNATMVVITEKEAAGGVQLFIIDKATLITGSPAVYSLHNRNINESPWPPLTDELQLAPVREYDDNGVPLPMYLVARSGKGVVIYSIKGPAATATFTVVGNVIGPKSTVPVVMPPAPEPQAGGIDYVLLTNGYSDVSPTNNFVNDPVLRNNSLYYTYNINPTTGGGTGPSRISVYWAQIDMSAVPSGGAPIFVQDGLAADDPTGNMNYLFPALSVNECNDVGIGFSGSSSTTFPSTYYTSRASGDPLGYMSAPTLGHAGLSTFSSSTMWPFSDWGRYSGTHVDSSDNSFWTFQPFSPSPDVGKSISSRWAGWINNFSVPSVLGVPTFTTRYINWPVNSVNPASTTGLNSPTNVLVDAANQRIFVSDTNNNRVVVFKQSCGKYMVQYSLGQPTLTSNYENWDGVTAQSNVAASQYGLSYPGGLAYDAVRKILFVADSNNRVVTFNVDPATMTTGEPASYVLFGQPNFTAVQVNAGNLNPTANSLWDPRGLLYDDANKMLYIVDRNNSRVLGVGVTTLSNDMSATSILGQPVFTSNVPTVTPTGLWGPEFAVIDKTGHFLYISDTGSSRVLAYPLTAGNQLMTPIGQAASVVLGQTSFTTQMPNGGPTGTWTLPPTQSSLYIPYGLAFDQTKKLLYVADPGNNWDSYTASNNRIMVFNMSSGPSTNMLASYELGQSSFTASGIDGGLGGPNAKGLHAPFGIDFDPATGKLFVAEQDNNIIKIFDVTTLSNYMSAVDEIGQPH